MKKTMYYSLPLFGNQFKGNVFDMVQLSAKFQIWCKQFGIDDTHSLCLWIAVGKENYGMTEEEIIANANSVIDKLPKEGIVDLSEIGVRNY